MAISDETLMAFADGELDATSAASVTAAIAADPALAGRVDMFRQTRRAVAESAQPAAVPDALIAHVRRLAEAAKAAETPAPSNVISLADRRRVPVWQLPVAASIALAVGLSVGLFRTGPDAPAGDLQVAILGDESLGDVLARLPSGATETLPSGGRITPIASFLNGENALCREFEYDRPDQSTIVSVACLAEKTWDVQLAIAASAVDDGYAPASSLDTLDAWLGATEAGAPMTAEDEAAALAAVLAAVQAGSS